MTANLENSAVAIGLEKLFSSQSQRRTLPRNVQTTTQLHSFHMLARSCSKSFKWALQQCVNQELPNGGEFRKDRRTRDQFANSIWIIEKAREFQKTICFINCAKAFHCVDHNKLWKILQVMGIPDHRCLLRNLYVGQETTVRTECGHRLVPNWKRSMSRLYIITLLI